jgi:hypothetical protein
MRMLSPSLPVALPDAIPVRYTEEEAGYVSFRPVVRQTFRLNELLDMVLTVTGKDPARIRTILRSGTVVFHFYRYWWDGFEVTDVELIPLLANFPDDDPSLPFRPAACAKILIQGRGSPGSVLLELDRKDASHKRLLRRHSVWDLLLATAAITPPVYLGYSHAYHADIYRLDLTGESPATLAAAAEALAPKNLRRDLRVIANAFHLVFTCPRGGK